MSDDIKFLGGGQTRSVSSPKLVEAVGKARVEFARVVGGSIVLGLILVAHVYCVYMGKDSHELIAILSGGLGYLLGTRGSGGNQSG